MNRKRDCWDNAPTESLWGSLKVGRLYGKGFASRRAAMGEIVDWLTFYNHRPCIRRWARSARRSLRWHGWPPRKGRPHMRSIKEAGERAQG